MTQKPVILCVDDEPVNLKLLYDILEPSGFKVIMAEDGKKALDKVGTEQVDIILLDVMMPEMDGFEVCRRIKSDQRTRTIPIIIITALGAKDDRIRGIAAGAEDHLTKPFDKAEVIARINMLLRVKSLDEKLNYAYNDIARLTSFGQEIINGFNPLNFDFETVIDSLVNQLIRQVGDKKNTPEYVLVRIHDGENHYRWHSYRYVFDEYVFYKTAKTLLDIEDQSVMGPILKDMKNLFFYDSTESTELIPLVKALGSYGFNVASIVCYISMNISVFCVNYGRTVSSFDAAVLNSLVLQAQFLRSLSEGIKGTSDAHEYSISALARAAEVNDEDTGDHTLRVGLYCELLAKKLHMSEQFVRDIKIQSQLHDVGKLHVPSSILKKPDKLTADEFAIIKHHPTCGAKIIGEHPRFKIAKNIALTHHEKWDGSGYPLGLSNDYLPIEGRIAALADQYDALRNKRVYKEAFDHDTACGIILTGDGRTMPAHFDPKVLKAFKDISAVFDETYKKLVNPYPNLL
jgi:response regulator RpfG family c-di-GMP phosphodiesterase